MSWINEHKHIWRIVFLTWLVIAISGPWFFDLTWVPPTYTCSAPHIRLDGNYCGLPISLFSFLPTISRDLTNLATRLFTGAVDLWGLLFGTFLLLLVLPFLSIITLIWRGDRQNWRAFHIVVLGLAVAASVFAGLLNFPRLHPALWGAWLYAILAAGMLLLEAQIAVTAVTNRRSPRE